MKIKVSVPATSANIGSGFDALGLAVTLYNTVTFEDSEVLDISSADEMSSTSLSSKVTVLYRVTARPSASKPEPMFALVAGTETLIFIAGAPFLMLPQAGA